MVPGAGLEPARHCCRGILSPLCLPISPPGQGGFLIWRRGSESNRRTRSCSPLHDHSATAPKCYNNRSSCRKDPCTPVRLTGTFLRRRRWSCSPLHDHSATAPYFIDAAAPKVAHFTGMILFRLTLEAALCHFGWKPTLRTPLMRLCPHTYKWQTD